MGPRDYYRVLNVARQARDAPKKRPFVSASSKEIKAAYLQLAKSLHPDVTDNDETKAERFKHVNEAYAVLSDAQKRREYDASLPLESFRPYNTSGMTQHPYAATENVRDLRARPLYGINEQVWLAHHYGPAAARRHGRPPRSYGGHVMEEKLEQQRERIERRQRHFKLHRMSGYFMRREARLKQHEENQAEVDSTGRGNILSGCTIS
ncbi:hypothetical protein PsorP6_011695 [Peronosclerospora sorghi]|uniref:Uncharacterized protein n=1 Tax=Peronosclerospora sorghi TaxID=230839 RepID=A0ACC0WJ78_9STRA|nr:hypothetical protein PsorP6_011695 [Peronosclerospora sorghi]